MGHSLILLTNLDSSFVSSKLSRQDSEPNVSEFITSVEVVAHTLKNTHDLSNALLAFGSFGQGLKVSGRHKPDPAVDSTAGDGFDAGGPVLGLDALECPASDSPLEHVARPGLVRENDGFDLSCPV